MRLVKKIKPLLIVLALFALFVSSHVLAGPGGGPIDPIDPLEMTYLESEKIIFKLSRTSAFIEFTKEDSPIGEEVDIEFTIEYNDENNETITIEDIQLTFTFDANSYRIVSANVDPNLGWNGDPIVIDDGEEGRYGFILSDGSISASNSSLTIAHIIITPICQNPSSFAKLEIIPGHTNSFIISGNYNITPDYVYANDLYERNGMVTIANYIAEFDIKDVVQNGYVGDNITVPVYGNINSLYYDGKHTLEYNNTLLEFVSATNTEQYEHFDADATTTAGEIVVIFDNIIDDIPNTLPEINGKMYEVEFKVKCPLINKPFNNPYSLNFKSGTDLNTTNLKVENDCIDNLDELDIVETYDNPGIIDFSSTASIQAIIDEGTHLFKTWLDGNQTITYTIQTKGDFIQGGLEEQIKFNIDHTPHLNYKDDYWNGTEAISFYHDENEEPNSSFKQVSEGEWSQSDGYVGRHTIEYYWEPEADFNPTLDTRIQPTFINTGSYGNTQLPDNEGCVGGSNENEYLDLGEFEGAKVAIGEVFIVDKIEANKSCVAQLIKIRSTFDVEGFSFTVNVDPTHYESFSTSITGVNATLIGNDKVKFTTDGTFSGISGDENYDYIGYINYECASIGGGPESFETTVDLNADFFMKDADGNELYVYNRDGDVTLDCEVNTCGNVQKTSINDNDDSDVGLPQTFGLHQNYPNPFNPITTISFDLPKQSDWNITIYNIKGQFVRDFVGNSTAGIVSVEWDASNVSSGIYLYKLNAGGFVDTKKMILLK